jgi:hypothetical protein
MASLRRVQRTAAATLDHVFYVGETGTNSAGPVTVTITDANGTVISTGTATSAGAGEYTYPLPPQAVLMLLTVAWAGTISGAAVVEIDEVEIVGGTFFTLAEGRASDPSLADPVKYLTADLEARRLEVEQECEEICDRSFFPRYLRLTLDGTGTSELMLTGHGIRTIRSVKVAPRVGQEFTAFTSDELAALTVTPDRVLVRTDGAVFLEGRQNVVVELEYGLDTIPADLKRASLVRFKSQLNVPRTGIPERAVSYTNPDGTSYRLSQPGPYETGIPYVDGVYDRYSLRDKGAGNPDGRPVPASRTLNYDPQRNSLYHGGVR